jgi:hypothetical protein
MRLPPTVKHDKVGPFVDNQPPCCGGRWLGDLWGVGHGK